MKIFLIAYDLKKVGRNYNELYSEIKSLGDWHHPLESVWFVAIDEMFVTANEIYEKLHPVIDDNDNIIVYDVTSQDRQGWAPKSLWSWLKEKERK
ncbi:MAG: hypothetical protein IKY84_01940 [Bacteroidaceae bacterium]|nr:hypothetical protein [Bacteroidaceae bacterium]